MRRRADDVVFVHFISDAEQIKFPTSRGNRLEFASFEDLARWVDRSAGDYRAQRKGAPVFQLAAARAQLIAVQFKILASQRQDFRLSSQLRRNPPVIRVIR